MYINGTQFNCEVKDILNELKYQLDANGIKRFEKMFDSGDNLMVCCPYHKNGQERRPSAGIRKSDGFLHCFNCDKSVGLDEMIANCFGYNDPIWGFRWLIRNFATVEVEEREDIKIDVERNHVSNKGSVLDNSHSNQPVCVTEDELDRYRYTHPYMYQRGLTDEIIEQFDIGYDKQTDSITFPVRDWKMGNYGSTMFIARRSIKTKRFDLPKNIEKPLYGLYELTQKLIVFGEDKCVPNEVYVCEGLFDCLRLWCNGKLAVAGFGCLFSEYQIKQLQGLPTRKLILALDNDKAGKEATEKLRKAIKNKIVTEVVIPDGKKDIGELTDEEIQNLQEVW